MKFRDVFDEKPSREFTERVALAAEKELAKLRADQPSGVAVWNSRRWILAGGAAAALALIFKSRLGTQTKQSAEVASINPEILEKAEMLGNLELMKDLDVLVDWSGEES